MKKNPYHIEKLNLLKQAMPDEESAVSGMLEIACEAAKKMVGPYIGESGVPFSLNGEPQFLNESAPVQVHHAAELLQGVECVDLRLRSHDINGALRAMFMVGFYAHEVALSAGRDSPSYVAAASHAKSRPGRQRGGMNSGTPDDLKHRAVTLAREKMKGGLRKTPACVRAAAELAKEGFERDGNTIARWLREADELQR